MSADPQAPRRPGRPKDEGLQSRRTQEILDAATAIFAERGYAATDVQLIADRLGVGKGTIYRYFPSKEELFLAAVDLGMSRLSRQMDQIVADVADPLDRIATGLRTYLSYFEAHPEVVELLIQERAQFRDRKQNTYFQHHYANVGPWREMFRELIREGKIRDIPVDRIIDVMADLVYGTMFTTYFSGRNKPLATQCDDILDVLFHGLLVG